MSELKLGELINDEQQRDAIHIAVAPVIADESLSPGDDIGISEGTADHATGKTMNPIGIVDPFLSGKVLRGDRFWMFLYPNTVTGMRHHWQHPAFSGHSSAVGSDKAVSEAWLRVYAMRHNTYDNPERAYERLVKCLKSGDLFFYGTDLHGFGELDDAQDLKMHAEIALGIKVNWDNFEFSCSC